MRTATDRRDLTRNRGFTLPEVLTTLGVLGVSLSLAVPGLDSITRSNLRATGINELVATLHVARSEAITRNTRIAICPSADGQHCGDVDWDAGWIRFADPNGDFRLSPGKPFSGPRRPSPDWPFARQPLTGDSASRPQAGRWSPTATSTAVTSRSAPAPAGRIRSCSTSGRAVPPSSPAARPMAGNSTVPASRNSGADQAK